MATATNTRDIQILKAITTLGFAKPKDIFSWLETNKKLKLTREKFRSSVERLISSGQINQIKITIGSTTTIYTVHSYSDLQTKLQLAEKQVIKSLNESSGFLSRITIERKLRSSSFPRIISRLAISRLAQAKRIIIEPTWMPNGPRHTCIHAQKYDTWVNLLSLIEKTIHVEGCVFLKEIIQKTSMDMKECWIALRHLLHKGRINEHIIAISAQSQKPIRVYYMPGRLYEIDECLAKKKRRNRIEKFLGQCEKTLASLNISDEELCKTTKTYLRQYLKEADLTGSTSNTVIAAVIIIAARVEGKPIPVSTMCKKLRLRSKTVLKHVNSINRELEIQKELPYAREEAYIPQFISHLNLTQKSEEKLKITSIELLKSIPSKNLGGWSPKTTAAAVIYITGLKIGPRLTQKSVALASEISEVGLRNAYKRIIEILDNLNTGGGD